MKTCKNRLNIFSGLFTANRKMIAIKLMLVAATIFFAVSVSFAQSSMGNQKGGQQGPPPIPDEVQIEKMVENLADAISLSTEQKTAALVLFKEHFNQVREKTSGNKRPKREEMEALKTGFEKQVKKLLSAEQQILFDDFHQKNHPNKGAKQRQ